MLDPLGLLKRDRPIDYRRQDEAPVERTQEIKTPPRDKKNEHCQKCGGIGEYWLCGELVPCECKD